ncbi:MAG: hypothetical protein WBC19_04435 [Pyrinomonadaceae bacterium]|nr:zf-HC2 domain-containing protein [Chloracidobacterium sp.]
MLDNCNKNGCKFTDEIVSYMYDEIGDSERSKFEQHLLDCTACTDEFAGISNARFSMFEWRKEEFAHLPTPNIVIPYHEKVEAVGFFAGLRDLLTLSGWPAAATVAAGLIVSIGLGFGLMNYLGGDQEMASNASTNVAVPPVVSPDDRVQSTDPARNENENVVVRNPDDRQIRPLRASSNAYRPRNERAVTTVSQRPNNAVVRNPSATTAKAPALTNYDDTDDKSLRLSDLFDEGGAE